MSKASKYSKNSKNAKTSGKTSTTPKDSSAKGKPKPPPEPEIVRVSNIIKPENDSREYRALILPNQLKVLLISDPTTDKAAAAMSVQVGSLSDPWERQGLAHFLEHVLFLESRKYPTDNFLKNYVTGRGGTVNAQTLLTDTVFYFDVAPAFLQNTLDRFASVFFNPLFPEDKVERELETIQLEFQDHLSDDDHRCERVRKQVGDKQHVYAKFEFGNKTTLVKDDKLLKDVINFYKTHYSANSMGLAILGKETLDQLEKFAIPMFGRIVNKNTTNPLHKEHPYPKEHCRKLIKMVPFKEVRKLILFFPLPYTMRSNALDYIIWLLAHEGPGGLLAELKSRGFCTCIHVHSPYHHGFAFLNIEMDLTQGITANDEIVTIIFQYLKLLNVQPQKHTYDEIKAIKDIKFHYREKVEPISYVHNLCFNLHVSLERCVLGRAFPEFVAEDIQYILDRLTPETVNIQVVSPIFKDNLQDVIIDPIYNIQYSVESINPEMLDAWAKVELNPRLVLPEINDLIPQSFALKPPCSSESEVPELISSPGDAIRVFHLQDAKYHIPKSFFGVFFRSEKLHASPLNLNLITLYIKLFMDHVNQQFFSGRLVSNSYSLVANKFGLEMFIFGFNDRLEMYAMLLIHELITFRIDAARYEILRDTQENQLKIFSTWAIRAQLNFFLDMLINSNAWSYDELKASWAEVTPEAMQALVSNILSHCQVELLCYGNVTREEAMSFAHKVAEMMTLCSKPGHVPMNPLVMLDTNRDIQLPTDVIYEFVVPNEEQENHGTLVFYQVGLEDQPLKARLELFHQLVYSPYFNQIRQTEQLAYVLALSFKYTYSGTIGLYALVQSAYSVEYIESRIGAFMDSNVNNLLRNITAEQFEKAKNSLISRLNETPKRLMWMASRLWGEITSGQYRFNRNRELVKHVKEISGPEEMMQFYKQHFQSGGANCRRLVIAIKSSKCNELPPKDEQKKEDQNKASTGQAEASQQTPEPASASQPESSPQSALPPPNPAEQPPNDLVKPVATVPNPESKDATASNPPPPTSTPPSEAAPSPGPPSTSSPLPEAPANTNTEPTQSPAPAPVVKRISIVNMRKFKCVNQHWPIPSIIMDNF